MDYLILILLGLSVILNLCLAFSLRQEKRKGAGLRHQLHLVEEQTEEDFYDKGKFSELGGLSAGITHEISSPLTVILGRLTKLMRTDFSVLKKEELDKGLEQIKKHTERIASIVQSVREYIYRDEKSVEDVIPLSEVIDSVLVFYGQRLKNHGIELKLKDVHNVYVSGHRGQYEQAILNLLSNSFDAIDALPEKWIEISTARTPEGVKIFVRDSGPGISADVRKKMLIPFFSTKKGKGSGLGLTVVKGIAERHGGEFSYIEDPHTTFLLELPKASAIHYHH